MLTTPKQMQFCFVFSLEQEQTFASEASGVTRAAH